jgi:hypothetical protein
LTVTVTAKYGPAGSVSVLVLPSARWKTLLSAVVDVLKATVAMPLKLARARR